MDEMSYLAGMMDADGWFSIQKTNGAGRSPSYTPVMGITNTSVKVMSWLNARFDGKILPARISGIGKKPKYEWRLRVNELRSLLPKLIPHLVIKKDRAQLLLELANTKSDKYRGTGVPLDVQERREAIYQEIRNLNGYSVSLGIDSELAAETKREGSR